jgi:hypothetical protein
MKKPDEGFFPHTKGGYTIHVPTHGDGPANVHYVLGYYGEDLGKMCETFWGENDGTFIIIPILAWGMCPRPELCTPQSLSAALKNANIEAGSTVEQAWQRACDRHHVPWPKQRQKEPKAA